MSADAEEGVHSFLDLAEVFLEAKRCLLKPWDFPPQATPLPAEYFRLRNDKGARLLLPSPKTAARIS
jgi:hypothetical protein